MILSWHRLFYWHDKDLRVMWTNEDGTVHLACAGCSCPKEAVGYLCKTRLGECGDWDDFRKFDPNTDISE